MPKYKAIGTPNAYRMLDAHIDFLDQVSTEAGDRLILSFEKILNRIAANPFSFPFADHLDAAGMPPKTYKKCLLEKRYKAIFRELLT